SIKVHVQERIDAVLRQSEVLGLALLSFVIVLREGVETALFVFGAGALTSPFEAVLGVGLGLFIAGVIGVGIIRVSWRLNLRRFSGPGTRSSDGGYPRAPRPNRKRESSPNPIDPGGSRHHGEILITFVGQAVSHAMQSMQSDSRIISDLSVRYCCHSPLPFARTLSLPVPFLPGAKSHSNTSTGQTSMQTPSATQPSKSTATWVPWMP